MSIDKQQRSVDKKYKKSLIYGKETSRETQKSCLCKFLWSYLPAEPAPDS